MSRIPFQTFARLGLTLSALGLALSGCGGPGPQVGDAVVFPEPGTNVETASPKAAGTTDGSTAGTSTGTTAGTGSTSTATTASPSSPVKAEGWGTLKGQITFSGEAPSPKVLQEKGKAEKDQEFCAVDAPIVSEALVVDGVTKGIKNVLVYLSKPTVVNEDARKAALAAAPVFDQAKCIFEPHVLALMVDEPMTLRSSDRTNHNVNVMLKNNTFNQTISPGESRPFTPTDAERTPGPVVCNIHRWMQAYWMVLDHPYFAVTDAKGNFEIKNVPAGTQKLVVWQESVSGPGFVTAPSGDDIVIKAGETVSKDFKIDASRVRAAQ